MVRVGVRIRITHVPVQHHVVVIINRMILLQRQMLQHTSLPYANQHLLEVVPRSRQVSHAAAHLKQLVRHAANLARKRAFLQLWTVEVGSEVAELRVELIAVLGVTVGGE
jgi:hypothetical protein